MTTIYKFCLALGLFVTGGEMAINGDEHAANIKKLASPLLLDKRSDKGIKEVPLSEFSHLPFGVERIEE